MREALRATKIGFTLPKLFLAELSRANVDVGNVVGDDLALIIFEWQVVGN